MSDEMVLLHRAGGNPKYFPADQVAIYLGHGCWFTEPVEPTPVVIAAWGGKGGAIVIGHAVSWTRGQSTHHGNIIEIRGDRLLVKNDSTGNDYEIDAADVVEVT